MAQDSQGQLLQHNETCVVATTGIDFFDLMNPPQKNNSRAVRFEGQLDK